MDWKHLLVLVAVLALGYYLGMKYPTALSGVPVIGNVL